MYAVKELCRRMTKPTTDMWHRPKRLGWHLVGSGRTSMKYAWQNHESVVTGHSDSDWQDVE